MVAFTWLRLRGRTYSWVAALCLVVTLTGNVRAGDPPPPSTPSFAKLDQEAADVETAGKDLMRSGGGTPAVREILKETLQTFTREELQKIEAEGDKGVPDAKRAQWERLKSKLNKVEARQDDFIHAYDALVKNQLDYFAEVGREAIRSTLEDVVPHLPPKDAKKLKKLSEDLSKKYAAYVEAKPLWGTPKDVRRRDNLAKCVKGFREFYDELEKITGPKRTLGQKVQDAAQAVMAKMRKMFEAMRLIYAVLPEGAKVLKSALFGKQLEPGKLPLPTALADAMKKFSEVQGINVEIHGKENLPPPQPPTSDTVRFYTPSHRHTLNDLVLMSRYAPEDTLMFFAVNNMTQGPLIVTRPLIKSNPAVLAVGHGSDPVEKLLENLKKGYSRNVVNYPEGGIPGGVEESSPIRLKFSTALLERLIKEGYNVEVVPVTYLDSARFMNQVDSLSPGKGGHLAAVVSPLVDKDMYLAMRAMGKDDQTISRFIRTTWLENFTTDEDHMFGLLRPSAVARESITYLRNGSPEEGHCLSQVRQAFEAFQ